MSIEALRSHLVPSVRPAYPAPAGAWGRIEATLGVQLPDDYKAFIAEYGVGHVDGYIGVTSPLPEARDTNLSTWALLTFEQNRYLELRRQLGEDVLPYPVFPQAGGVLPWGSDTNGGVFYWVTAAANPNDWPILELQDGDWSRFDGTMSDFLVAVLSGQHQSVALGEEFPSTVPTYFDPWWQPHNGTVDIAPVDHAVEKQVELVQSVFTAVIPHRDPDSQERSTSVSMVVPSRGWKVRYWGRNRGPDYKVGVVIGLLKEDVAEVDPYVLRLARSLGGDLLSVVGSDN
jgi:hypothetical protein